MWTCRTCRRRAIWVDRDLGYSSCRRATLSRSRPRSEAEHRRGQHTVAVAETRNAEPLHGETPAPHVSPWAVHRVQPGPRHEAQRVGVAQRDVAAGDHPESLMGGPNRLLEAITVSGSSPSFASPCARVHRHRGRNGRGGRIRRRHGLLAPPVAIGRLAAHGQRLCGRAGPATGAAATPTWPSRGQEQPDREAPGLMVNTSHGANAPAPRRQFAPTSVSRPCPSPSRRR